MEDPGPAHLLGGAPVGGAIPTECMWFQAAGDCSAGFLIWALLVFWAQ